MSTNSNEAKMWRTFGGTQKAFLMFMSWIKGVLMYMNQPYYERSFQDCVSRDRKCIKANG